MEDHRTVVPLDYGPPTAPVSASRVFLGVSSAGCVMMALFGITVGCFGVARWFGQEDKEFDGLEFLWIPGALIVLGVGFFVLALLWGRRALGRGRRTGLTAGVAVCWMLAANVAES